MQNLTKFEPMQHKPPATPAQLADALTPLNDLLREWKTLPVGKTLADTMDSETAAAKLSTLNPLTLPGEPMQIATIIERLLAVYPSKGDLADSVVEDWVRVLSDQPLASVWEAYERHIRRPGQWAPSIGDFLQTVKSHAASVARVRLSLKGERA